jgi:hypothetical protein
VQLVTSSHWTEHSSTWQRQWAGRQTSQQLTCCPPLLCVLRMSRSMSFNSPAAAAVSCTGPPGVAAMTAALPGMPSPACAPPPAEHSALLLLLPSTARPSLPLLPPPVAAASPGEVPDTPGTAALLLPGTAIAPWANGECDVAAAAAAELAAAAAAAGSPPAPAGMKPSEVPAAVPSPAAPAPTTAAASGLLPPPSAVKGSLLPPAPAAAAAIASWAMMASRAAVVS